MYFSVQNGNFIGWELFVYKYYKPKNLPLWQHLRYNTYMVIDNHAYTKILFSEAYFTILLWIRALCQKCNALYSVQFCIVLHCTVLYCVELYRTVPNSTVPFRAIPYRTSPNLTVPCRAVPCRTVPYRAIPYCTVLFYTIGYFTLPYRTVLYRGGVRCGMSRVRRRWESGSSNSFLNSTILSHIKR
jgi:hypothetical protein